MHFFPQYNCICFLTLLYRCGTSLASSFAFWCVLWFQEPSFCASDTEGDTGKLENQERNGNHIAAKYKDPQKSTFFNSEELKNFAEM